VIAACLFSLSWWQSHTLRSVTVILRVTEGNIESKGAELGAGALRAHVKDLALTRERLLDLMRRHPREFPDAVTEPEGALEDLRDRIDIEIYENDFNEERSPSDPPRSARVALTVTESTAALSLMLARELAEMVGGATVARERAALLREQEAAELAMKRAEAHAADEDDNRSAVPGDPRSGAARAQLRALGDLATATRVRVRAADEQKTLRFELVDPGQLPRTVPRSAIAVPFVVSLLAALLAAALLAGALDPRIIDGEDLRPLGVVPLGQVPDLPPPPAATVASTAARGAPERAS